jgi:hypothetical protein
LATALLVAGCGDGGGDAESDAAAPTSGSGTVGGGTSSGGSGGSTVANRAPTISGAPQAMVLHDNRYSFTPTGADPDGNSLTFAIAGLPAWATFDTATGRLSGKPSAGDVGSYANVRISVSDGQATASLAPFTINVVATASGSAALSWLPPTANTDGSALTDLAGYRIYWGGAPGNYEKSVTLNGPGVASHLVEPLTPGTWYFTVTAMNADGIESAFSNVASKTVQ